MATVFGTLILLLALVFLCLGVWYIARERFKGRVTSSLALKLFLVTLPISAKDEKKKETEIIAVMEQLYSSFYAIKMKNARMFFPKSYMVLELAVPHVGEEVHFYIAVPDKVAEDAQKQIYSYFPTAKVAEAKDYNIFNPQGKAVAAYVTLSSHSVLPVRTYAHLEADPIREITNAFSKLKEVGEGVALQVIFRPASRENQKKGTKTAKALREGKTISEAMHELNKNTLEKTIAFFKNPSKKEESKAKSTSVGEDAIKQIESKASKLQFEANVRLVASAPTEGEAETILRQLENSFSQFSNPLLNTFKLTRVTGKALDRLLFNFSFRIFSNHEKIILSSEELTSIYHFPNVPLETPKVKMLKAKPSEPPVNLPREGIVLGNNMYRGDEREVRMLRDDRRRHLYVVGQTGTGKSTFLKNMILQDITAGEGVGVIDPHGDLVEDILGQIPKSRAEDVILIDPSDLERPLGLNMLEYDPRFPEQKTFIINELISILDKLYDLKTTGGPMFEQYTRNALQLLMEYPEQGYTLLEIPKVLADKEFRARLLKDCKNILVKDFWEKEAEKAGGEAALQNMAPYITSKFNVFIANDYIRPMIAQSKNSVNFRAAMDTKKIILVSLSKGRLGDINSSLIGLIIVGKLLMAAFSRVDVAESERNDFYLYLDEFQNFSTNSIATILSEARKYKLDLVIAHQFIEQLKKEIKDAVFGNVGSAVAFRVGAEDAEKLVKQFFEPVFNQNDLVNIDNFNAYIKLMIANTTSKPFSLAIDRPINGNQALAGSIRSLSRAKYGRDKETIEEEIRRRIM